MAKRMKSKLWLFVSIKISASILVMLCSVACQRNEGKAPTQSYNSIDQLMEAMQSNRKLSSKDVEYCFSVAEKGSDAESVKAVLLLTYSSRNNLNSVGRVDKLIYKKCLESSRPSQTALWLSQYELLHKLSVESSDEIKAAWLKVSINGSNLETISDNERQFIGSAAKGSPVEKRFIGDILASKRNLSPDNVAWSLNEMKKIEARAEGDEKQYWNFVSRVFSARNEGQVKP